MDYLSINKNSWNRKVPFHLKSKMYNMEGFLQGETSLKQIELDLLGDISGKKILHLQCHFGQDSISLSRMGAEVTGVDFSNVAIEKARHLTKECNTNTKFICCDVYDLPNHLDETFDLVFTSYGVLGWLPDMQTWARVVSQFLKPQGKLILVEFHPVLWMFDDKIEQVGYNYFNEGSIVETYEGTYADKDAPIKQEYVMWNHALSEVFSALIENNLQLTDFKEYDYSPYDILHNSIQIAPNKYQSKIHKNRLPLVYSWVGIKL